ncbi:hypothetical protein [uncultured Desulfobacter sp.]|uniref:hypothetical protein n=1 Tax=uncultured Desulfobacter sp. TaxID=240139 RepID=UPI002AA7C68F|nr:hypothetical protein [uncultured Desulfobacter sp.]
MKLTDKKILITDAEGFIGSHLTETLLDMGCSVRALSLYNSFNDWGAGGHQGQGRPGGCVRRCPGSAFLQRDHKKD